MAAFPLWWPSWVIARETCVLKSLKYLLEIHLRAELLSDRYVRFPERADHHSVFTLSGYTWILRNTFKSKSSCPALIQRRSLGFGLGVYSPKGQTVRQFHISRVNVTDSDCTRFPDGGHCASAGFRPRDQVCGLGNATCLGHCGMRV